MRVWSELRLLTHILLTASSIFSGPTFFSSTLRSLFVPFIFYISILIFVVPNETHILLSAFCKANFCVLAFWSIHRTFLFSLSNSI